MMEFPKYLLCVRRAARTIVRPHSPNQSRTAPELILRDWHVQDSCLNQAFRLTENDVLGLTCRAVLLTLNRCYATSLSNFKKAAWH
jgi:hypothetical protein